MITFLKDWARYPHAIIDTMTKNRSFVELAAVYREMGIKNHSFILQLHNRSLQGVDPFSKNLTPQQALAIALECKENFWYFIREIARDPMGSDEFPLMLNINRGLVATYWMFFNSISVYLIMIRQTGKSFGLDWLWTYLVNIRLTKSDVSLMTLNDKLRGRQVERLKGMEMVMPRFLKRRKKTDPGNTEVLRISKLGNALKFYISNLSVKIADTIGRGMTSATNGFDEFAYIPNNKLVVGVMMTAAAAAREVAALKNEPFGSVFSTTSGKRDTPEGSFAYSQVHDAAEFTEKFFDAENREELVDMVNAGSKRNGYLAVNVTMNHRQLGKDDDWLRARIRDSQVTDEVQIRADFFNDWPKGGNSDVFKQSELTKMRDSQNDNPYYEITEIGKYTLRWYIPPDRIKAYLDADCHVMAIDPSEAIGADSIGIVLGNIKTGGVVMVADINIAFISQFCAWLADFMINNPKVLLNVERRSTGLTVIELISIILIRKGINPFKRIFNLIVQEASDPVKRERFNEIANGGKSEDMVLKYQKYFGFNTSGSGNHARSVLYGQVLRSAVLHGAHLMNDKKLIDQVSGLEIINYRIDHRPGEHDDLVIAWSLFYWTMLQGTNLSFYGIDPSEILSNNKEMLAEKSKMSDYERFRQSKEKNKINEYLSMLEDEADPFIIERIEREIKRLISTLPQEDQIRFSKDDILTKVRERRKAFFSAPSSTVYEQKFDVEYRL